MFLVVAVGALVGSRPGESAFDISRSLPREVCVLREDSLQHTGGLMGRWIGVREVARLAEVSHQQVYQLVREGRIPPAARSKLPTHQAARPGALIWDERVIRQWLKTRRTVPGPIPSEEQ